MTLLSDKINAGRLALLTFCLAGLVLPGLIWPDAWWGVHHLAFLSKSWQLVFGAGAVVFILFAFVRKFQTSATTMRFWHGEPFTTRSAVLLSLLLGVLCWAFPIAGDNYGEASNYAKYLTLRVSELPPQWWDWVLGFDLAPATGRNTQLALVSLAAWLTGGTYEFAFRLLDSLFAIGFSLVWLLAVRSFINSKSWQVLLSLAGLSAPFMLIFFGHIDTYGSVFFGLLVWMVCLLQLLRSGERKWLWWLIGLWLVNLKLHPLNVLLAPGLALAACWHFIPAAAISQRLFSFKGIAILLFLPVTVVGMGLYFFVFEDHIDPRELRNIQDFDRLFLPLFSPPAPLDRYNMLSPAHFFDGLNMVWLWCPAILFLVLSAVVFFRKAIHWTAPDVFIPATLLVLFSAFLFTVNPLVTMPMDWDLFSFPAPILMVLALALLAQLETRKVALSFAFKPLVMLFVWLSIPVFIVNANPTSLSYRLESVALWVYRSYYEKAPEYIYFAHNLVPENDSLLMERKRTVIEKMRPHAVVGHDVNFATMLTDLGAHHLQRNEFHEAYAVLHQGPTYAPRHRDNRFYLLQAEFMLEKYDAAFSTAEHLLALEYPTRRKALRMLIHTGLAAQRYDEVKTYAAAYLKEFPDDATIQEVHQRLESEDSVETLLQLFSR